MITKTNKFEYSTMIKEQHLDSFGHVNNAVYLTILEEARWDFVTANGYGLDVVHKLKKGPVILNVNLDFKRELKNRETIRIVTEFQSFKGKISKILQTIYNQKNEEACVALFTVGFFDLQLRKLIAPTPEWLKALHLENS